MAFRFTATPVIATSPQTTLDYKSLVPTNKILIELMQHERFKDFNPQAEAAKMAAEDPTNARLEQLNSRIQQGGADAATAMYEMALETDMTALDYQQRFHGFNLHAAVGGHVDALQRTGFFLLSEFDITPTAAMPKYGLMLLLAAAEKDNGMAYRVIMDCYRLGQYGLKMNENQRSQLTAPQFLARVATDLKLGQPELVIDANEFKQYDDIATKAVMGVNQRNPYAELAYANMQLLGIHGVKVDLKQAIVRLQKLAAVEGATYSYQAKFELAKCYANGVGVTQSLVNAEQLFINCAEHGMFLYEIGVRYLTGEGVQRNRQKAFECFERAALHSAPASYLTAYNFEHDIAKTDTHLCLRDYRKTEEMRIRQEDLSNRDDGRYQQACLELGVRIKLCEERYKPVTASYYQRAEEAGFKPDAEFDKLLQLASITDKQYNQQQVVNAPSAPAARAAIVNKVSAHQLGMNGGPLGTQQRAVIQGQIAAVGIGAGTESVSGLSLAKG